MHDILRETPIYQEILREGQEEAVQAFRQAIIEIIQERFPKLERLAKKQITFVEDVVTLRLLTVKVGTAQNAEEVRQHLLAVDEDEDQ